MYGGDVSAAQLLEKQKAGKTRMAWAGGVRRSVYGGASCLGRKIASLVHSASTAQRCGGLALTGEVRRPSFRSPVVDARVRGGRVVRGLSPDSRPHPSGAELVCGDAPLPDHAW